MSPRPSSKIFALLRPVWLIPGEPLCFLATINRAIRPLPQRFFPIRLVIASGVFWCAFMGAGVALRPVQNAAPPPAASELFATPTMVRTLAITPEPSFEQRWQVPTPQFTPWIVDQDEPSAPNGEQRSARGAEKRHQGPPLSHRQSSVLEVQTPSQRLTTRCRSRVRPDRTGAAAQTGCRR